MPEFWHVDERQITPADHHAFVSMASLLACPMTPVTRDRRSGVSRLALAHSYYVKVFRGTGSRLQYLAGLSRFQRERRNLRYFAQLGLATPPLAAWGVRRRFGALHSAVLVTREVECAVDLQTLLRSGMLHTCGIRTVRTLLDQLAAAVRAMHADGFCHCDLKARNILVRVGDSPELCFFDCPRGHRPPRLLLRRRIVRDLAHLEHDLRSHLRRSDLLYLFQRYRQVERLGGEDKALLRQTLAYYPQRRLTRRRRLAAEGRGQV